MARRASERRAVLRPIPRRTLLPQSRSKPELHGPDAEKPAGLPAGSQEFGSLPPPVRQGWLDYLSDPRFGPERVFALVMGLLILLVLPLALAVLFIDDIEEALKNPTQPARESPRRAVELADDEIRAGNPAGAEEILRAALTRGELPAKVHRKLAGLLLERGDFSGALENISAAIRLDPTGEDFFIRGQCDLAMGMLPEAGADFARAAELSPSTPLYSNRHYLFLIAAGDLEPVRDRMKLGARLGLQNATDGWIVAAAALHLLDGEPTQAAEMLARASASLTKADLACLLANPVFDPYRQSPILAKYLAKPAPPQ